MTVIEKNGSNQDDNEIEKWQRFDNYLKKFPLNEDALEETSEQYRGLRKIKSDLELSKCTCSTGMGSTVTRPRSFHDFEMLEDENVPKKQNFPDTSDFSEDDYMPLDSTDGEIHTEDEVYESTMNEHNSQRTDHGQVQDNSNNQNLATNNSDQQSCGEENFLSETSLNEIYLNAISTTSDCASFCETSTENQSHPHNSNNSSETDNNSEQVVKIGAEVTKNDFALKCLTLPKTKSCLGSTHSRRSLRQTFDSRNKAATIYDALDNDALNVPRSSAKINANSESEMRRSLKKLKPCESLHDEPRNNRNTLTPTCPSIEAVHLPCTTDPDVFNVLLTEQQLQCIQSNADSSRPRQYGRRSNPVRISSFAIESSDNGAARIIAHHHQQERRPMSAPVQRSVVPEYSSHRRRDCLPSEVSSLESSRNSSPISVASSSDSSVADPIVDVHQTEFVSATSPRSDEDTEAEENSNESKEFWPHSLSRPICCLFCTLGLFNLSRFAIFTVHFGANFLVQFSILSFIFGIPLLWLQMCLGQKIKGGIVTMFRVTPICKGIGVALLISHCIITLYSSVSIAWLLIYIRDSFISTGNSYKWEERFESFRGYQNISALRLSENIADYFNGIVLQRLSNLYEGSQMKFQLAFNVSIVWILVFVLLCRGIRSLGQIIIGMAVFSFLGLSVVCIKFLTLLSFETIQDIFPATNWQDFFANSNSWSVAAQESFLTWGLLSVSVYSMYCKTDKTQRLDPYVLRREAFLVVFLTFFGLFLGAVLGSTCIIILKLNGFNYYPASFENPKNDIFLWPAQHPVLPSFHHSIPSKWTSRFSSIIGESFDRPTFVQGVYVVKESGYKPIRLVTEILPATLAISSRIEPVWGVIAYISLFLLGLAQLGIMWKPIAGAIGNNVSAILLSCVTGLFLGFPLTTDNGIVITHYLDFIFGGSWWLLVLWMSFIIAIFMIRGSPYTSDVLAKDLRLNETFSVFLAFSWNVLVPLALILLSVMEYKKSHSNELFLNHRSTSGDLNHLTNWPFWAKRLGGLLQLSLLIVVPIVSIVQIYVYLSKGPRDILERIELLFRPPLEPSSHVPVRRLYPQPSSQSAPVVLPLSDTINLAHINDVPPPKYSPPPSYGRAMGARVAKVLRNSIRRSVRRFRRNDDVRVDAEVPSYIPSISSRVQDSVLVNSVNDFIRSRIQRQNEASHSVENLLMSDMSLNTCNQTEISRNSSNRH